jgi:hypothetical protein
MGFVAKVYSVNILDSPALDSRARRAVATPIRASRRWPPSMAITLHQSRTPVAAAMPNLLDSRFTEADRHRAAGPAGLW